MKEATGLPYASTNTVKRKGAGGQDEEVPLAHLCGHDAHVTWMLGLAKVLGPIGRAHSWLVAQPAEELIEGAKAMVSDGIYTKHKVAKPDYLIGLPTTPVVTDGPGELHGWRP